MTKRSLHPVAKSGKPLSDKRLAPALQIELVHTTDDPAHGSIPPLGDGWHLARSANGVTLWRRIQFPLRSRLPSGRRSAGFCKSNNELEGKCKWSPVTNCFDQDL
jgi:hypothetical protein